MQEYDDTYLTPRVEKLLHRLPSLTGGSFYTRRILWTESYRGTEGQPQVIRQAKAFAHLLLNVPIVIYPDELIVGAHPKGTPSEEENQCLKEAHEYWRGKTIGDRVAPVLTKEERAAIQAGVYTSSSKTGHMTPDFEKVLKVGLKGIREEVSYEIENLKLSDPMRSKKSAFLRAAAITLDAACAFAQRYADEATRLAEIEDNPECKNELLRISEICRRVPMEPAQTFHEACQVTWFIHLLVCFEEGESHAAFAPGRFDQYVYPYYKNSIQSGEITKADAAELIDCLWIKFNEIGSELPQTITLGGKKRDGTIGDNELTILCMDSTERLRLVNPSLMLRCHDGTPAPVIDRACKLIKTGIGFPQLYNDDLMCRAMLYAGATEEDARDAVPGGCVELSIQGKTNPWVGNFFNLPKCLLLALNNGIDPTSGTRIGLQTGDVLTPGPSPLVERGGGQAGKGFDDVMDSYKHQVAYFMELMAASENSYDVAQAEVTPFPFLSSLVSDCIKSGLDITEGGARYDFTEVQGVGIANVADSLAAIKKFVFQEKRISLSELVAAMWEDFDNHESLRQMLLNDAPKYGNNEPFVDEIAREVVYNFYEEVQKYTNPRGGKFIPGLLTWTLAEGFGSATGATPDGRRNREVLSDSIGAAQGRDIEGPTALMESVTQIDYTPVVGGLSFNMKFTPTVLSTDDSLHKLQSLIRTYFKLGGMQVQINVVDKETLLEAQRFPEKYRNLIVRVSGWSARFTTLSKTLQDDIISRTAQKL
jgi:formate C-acetyltransferase